MYVEAGQLALSLAVILIGIRFGLKAGAALIFGSLVLILLPISQDYHLMSELYRGFFTAQSMSLLLVLGLFGYYNNLLRNSRGIEAVVDCLRRRVINPGTFLLIIPMILGWLISPGGVILSLESIDRLLPEGSKPQKAGLCMFFRHVQYPILPIHPALMLLTAQAGIGFSRFFIANLPVVILAVGAGYWVYLRKYEIELQQRISITDPQNELWATLCSLGAVIIIAVITLRLELALAVGITVFLLVAGTDKLNVLRDFDKNLILIGVGFILYQYGISLHIDKIVLNSGAKSLLLINLVLPGVIAFISGSCLLGVGCSLPILLGGLFENTLASLQILYFSSLLGYYLSPVHLCSILAREYAGAKLPEWYGILLRPFPIIGVGIALCFIIFKLC